VAERKEKGSVDPSTQKRLGKEYIMQGEGLSKYVCGAKRRKTANGDGPLLMKGCQKKEK